jgi:uncharacterized membrane protein (DUF106 family)
MLSVVATTVAFLPVIILWAVILGKVINIIVTGRVFKDKKDTKKKEFKLFKRKKTKEVKEGNTEEVKSESTDAKEPDAKN